MSADDSTVSGADSTDENESDAPSSAVATKAKGSSSSKKRAEKNGSVKKVSSKAAGPADSDPAEIDAPTTVSKPGIAAETMPLGDADASRISDDATAHISAADLFADAETDDNNDVVPAAYQFADAGESVEVDESVALGRPTWQMRRAARRLRARKVRRLVRYVDPWSVLKVSFLFYLCLFVILLLAGVLLWTMAVNAGTVGSVESFIEDLFAFGSYTFDADLIFRAAAIGGLVLVFAMTALNVLLAILFNLISDLTGGLRFTVIEEETARPRPRRGRVFADPDDDGY